jgi:hypothetical protein
MLAACGLLIACSPKIITELFDTNNLSAIHFATSSTLIASIDVINAMSFDFNYRTNSENIVAPDRTVVILAEVLKSIHFLQQMKFFERCGI